MRTRNGLDVFLNPQSVAVVGASDKPLSWGCFIMRGLLSVGYTGKVYPVNPNHGKVKGITAFKDLRDIEGPVDLAILIVPEHLAVEAVEACAEKGVQGITLITAGLGEASDQGRYREENIARIAASNGIRLLGPNVSGTFNLLRPFNESSCDARSLKPTKLAGICQGAWAFHDILTSGFYANMGVGKLVQTGNEADLTVTDFIEYFASDPEVEGIIVHIESIKGIERFADSGRNAAQTKPVVVFKAANTAAGRRASEAHTGTDCTTEQLSADFFTNLGMVAVPCPELLLPIGHALTERPSLDGPRIGIVTMGASWGVALTDVLEIHGMKVLEFSSLLQETLRSLGLPKRASVRNPVDFGASGRYGNAELLASIGRAILSSGEVDGLILHGIGRPVIPGSDCARSDSGDTEVEKAMICSFHEIEKDYDIPVTIACHYSRYESPAVNEAEQLGIRIYHRLDDVAEVLSGMHLYASGIKST